ncbi:MAG TPA: SCP2 sterol-binding domain-containing protein [Dyella sp.]
MDILTCTEQLRKKAAASPNGDSGLNATLKFDCGSDGIIFLDGEVVPNTVTNDQRDAECTVTISLVDLCALLQGQLNPASAFMTGKLRVTGDMSVAMRLQRLV